jgi:crossover junction endodeoxyribonuclease RusA
MSASVVPELDVERVTFSAFGVPVPQGSKNAIRQGERTLIVERGRATLHPWRALVAASAIAAGVTPLTGPVSIRLSFRFPRPKSHFRAGAHAGELKPTAPAYVGTRPDVDKLARSILDALTGIAFRDDGQVAELSAGKRYAEPDELAGVEVELVTLP